MSPLAHLPDLCMLALLRALPPADQIIARKVCRRWQILVEYATLSFRSLTLLLGPRSMADSESSINHITFFGRTSKQYLLKADGSAAFPEHRINPWNCLVYDDLDINTVEDIATTLTGVKSLQIAMKDTSPSQAIYLAKLLEKWRHQLIAFKLSDGFTDIEPLAKEQLFAAINGLATLKHLTLYLFDWFIDDLPILPHLNVLHFFSPSQSTQFAQILAKYSDSICSLSEIEYDCNEDSNLMLSQFISLPEHLRKCFHRLDFFTGPVSDPKDFCAHFASISSLNLAPTYLTIRYLFDHLAKLCKLLHLRLIINFGTVPEDNLKYNHLPQIKSIKALELAVTMSSHKELSQLNLDWTMPNVEVIEFTWRSNCLCTDCDIGPDVLTERSHECARQMFGPLKKQCTKLQVIRHNREDKLGTFEELLAE